jgi:hypothetical protein
MINIHFITYGKYNLLAQFRTDIHEILVLAQWKPTPPNKIWFCHWGNLQKYIHGFATYIRKDHKSIRRLHQTYQAIHLLEPT